MHFTRGQTFSDLSYRNEGASWLVNRTTPEKLKTVQRKFNYMIRVVSLGVCSPSKSSWENTAHVVPNLRNEWHMCGNENASNNITVPGIHRGPHLHNFFLYTKRKIAF